MDKIYEIKLDDGMRIDCLAEEEVKYHIGSEVVIQKEQVVDLGTIERIIGTTKDDKEKNTNLPRILRHANLHDQSKAHENHARTPLMHKSAEEEIAFHKLEMKLINTHCSLDEKLITFLFTADGRVDFRGLVKTLSKRLSTRIELRQVGVRDETTIIGGIGTCGRPLCCNTFLRKFESINVRTAKDQGLPLNPATISGACSRLKCCLKYEHEGYVEMKKGLPKVGANYNTPEGRGRILEVNCMKREIKVKLNDEGHRVITVTLDESGQCCATKESGDKGCCGSNGKSNCGCK